LRTSSGNLAGACVRLRKVLNMARDQSADSDPSESPPSGRISEERDKQDAPEAQSHNSLILHCLRSPRSRYDSWSLDCSKRGMFQISLRMMARPNRSMEAVEALRSIRISSRMNRGFIEGRIYQEVDNPDALCFEQDWSSEQELKSHIRSNCFTDLLMLMETSPEVPQLEIHSVRDVFGINYIEAVRYSDN
jgi:quinol monooxygenase YgiN